MLCKACNEITTNNFIKCDCGLYLHYECLYKYNVLPNDYANISQSKYAIHILKSPFFKFTCKSCSLNGEYSSKSIDFNKKFDELTTSITAINTKLASLSNINETISSTYSSILKTNLNSPTIHNIRPTIHNNTIPNIHNNIHSVPTIRNQFIPSIIHPTIHNIRPTIHNSTRPTIHNNIHSVPTIRNQSIPSIVIEHIDLKNRNISYIKSLFSHLRLHYNTIGNISFHSHYCNIIVSSPYIRDTLLNSKSETIDSPFSRLFIRPYIDDLTAKRGKVLYHAYKAKLTNTNYKCVFNRRTSIYELRPTQLISNTEMISWKCKPYVPTEEQYISWCTDYKSYLDNKSNNPHTNTENTNDNIKSTSTDPHTDNENTKDSKDNTANISDNNVKRT